MLKRLRQLIVVIVLFLTIAYLSLVALSLPYQSENTEYPEWEDYVDYWNNEWVRVVNRAYSKDNYLVKYPADGDRVCVQTSVYKRFGFIPISTRMCFIGKQTRWVRYIWHIPVGYKQHWTDPEGRWYVDFPHGPYTIHKPRPSKPKQVYARPITDDEIVNWFLKLTLEHEIDSYIYGSRDKNNDELYIYKLLNPLNIVVDDLSDGELFDGKTVTQHLDEFLVQLKQLTGVELNRIERGAGQEDITIAFLYKQQRPELKTLIDQQRQTEPIPLALQHFNLYSDIDREDALCLASLNTVYGELKFAYIIAYLDRKDPLRCIQEEIIQSIGINNDVREINPTIFNDYSPQPRLTKLDEVFLRILYTAEIKPYLSADEVRPIVQAIVKRYRQEGQLEGLQRRVYRP